MYPSTFALESPYWISYQKKGTKGPEVTSTSQVTSAPVIAFLSAVFGGEGNLTELVPNNGLQFPSLKSPSFLGENHGTQLTLSMLPWGQQKSQMLGFDRVFTDPLAGKENVENLPCELPTCVRSPRRHNNGKVTCQAELLEERKTHEKLTGLIEA